MIRETREGDEVIYELVRPEPRSSNHETLDFTLTQMFHLNEGRQEGEKEGRKKSERERQEGEKRRQKSKRKGGESRTNAES